MPDSDEMATLRGSVFLHLREVFLHSKKPLWVRSAEGAGTKDDAPIARDLEVTCVSGTPSS